MPGSRQRIRVFRTATRQQTFKMAPGMPNPRDHFVFNAIAHVTNRSHGDALDRSPRVTLNFHPDRMTDGVTVLEALGREGAYRNQFETGTSNGGLTAYPAGARWSWGHHIFGGVYDQAPPSARPKYGALNYRRCSVGVAPRFGSAHLRLREHVLDRTTFCFPDSVSEPDHFGTAANFDLFRLAEAFAGAKRTERDEAETGGPLDDYVEAHVHGAIDITRDVEALVLDPCYRGTDVEMVAQDLPVLVEWHSGLRLAVSALRRHPDFRGTRIVSLAAAISEDRWLDAKVVGDARKQSG